MTTQQQQPTEAQQQQPSRKNFTARMAAEQATQQIDAVAASFTAALTEAQQQNAEAFKAISAQIAQIAQQPQQQPQRAEGRGDYPVIQQPQPTEAERKLMAELAEAEAFIAEWLPKVQQAQQTKARLSRQLGLAPDGNSRMTQPSPTQQQNAGQPQQATAVGYPVQPQPTEAQQHHVDEWQTSKGNRLPDVPIPATVTSLKGKHHAVTTAAHRKAIRMGAYRQQTGHNRQTSYKGASCTMFNYGYSWAEGSLA